MIGVEEAQARLLALASPLPAISVPVAQAVRHYLAEDVIARRTQPAADLSAMDGYAIRFADMPGPWRVTGESAAGRPFVGGVGAAEAVRIFTGAHVPRHADCVLIQEDAERVGDILALTGDGRLAAGTHIRGKGMDFSAGECLLETGMRLNAGAIAAAIMAGHGSLAVGGRPKIRIIASGDELLPPGEPCDPAHIPSSNSIMLAAMLDGLPCDVEDKGILPDDLAALEAVFRDCADADIIVSSGGASVGDHDLVQQALHNAGATIDFWRVAMRPGKPLMAGRLSDCIVLGLPGNPSSAFVTAFLFLLPLIRHMAGSRTPLPPILTAILAHPLPAGGVRTDYFRACAENGYISIFNQQDSGLLAPLFRANALLIHPKNAPSASAASTAHYFLLE